MHVMLWNSITVLQILL